MRSWFLIKLWLDDFKLWLSCPICNKPFMKKAWDYYPPPSDSEGDKFLCYSRLCINPNCRMEILPGKEEYRINKWRGYEK
jgi:hypothetical protein